MHTLPLPADAWAEFARDEGFTGPLAARLRRLGASAEQARSTTREFASDVTWRGIASLDAAVRFVESLVSSGGLSAGAQAFAMTYSVARQAFATADDEEPFVGPEFWTVRPGGIVEGDETLKVRGVILLQVTALTDSRSAQAVADVAASEEMGVVTRRDESNPIAALWKFLRDDGLFGPAVLMSGVVVTAMVLAVEALVLRGLIDLSRALSIGSQRLGASVALLVFMGAVIALEFPLAWGTARMGRRMESRLRLALMKKLPRLDDQFFGSRLTSDMANRCHAISAVAALPSLGASLLRTGATLLGTGIGLVWLMPSAWWLVALAVLASTGLPLLVLPLNVERGMRVLTHSSALSKFYFDALRAVIPIRTHGAQRAVRREQESRLAAWADSILDLQKISVGTDAVLSIVGFVLVVALIGAFVSTSEGLGTLMLVLYWTLNLPTLGMAFATALRAYPSQRNVVKRLTEILDAPERTGGAGGDAGLHDHVQPGTGIHFSMRGVQVVAGGHTILDGIDLEIPSGQHVAIVGGSGSGKSSLVALTLGWFTPSEGQMLVNGAPLDARILGWLRARAAWVDPEVQIWNQTMLDNLRYGRAPWDQTPLGQMIADADMQRIPDNAPQGMQTVLGAGGCRMSGGEQQRVRFGRVIHRPDVNLVLLDEAFRGLDGPTRRSLMAKARSVWAHATILCVTHDIEAALDFHRVLVVGDGKILEDGKPRDLANTVGSRFRDMLEVERELHERYYADPRWRRLWVERGVVQERGAEPGASSVAG